ncbi:hypothetical protein IFM89_015700 [Coptis chinensis]|uniref:Uncharacterized protein n=1 Tax=Coptis chinensis TaxID=261450 RepID=A0A835ICG3_9MAGN|nr:hypothetical protein IFM89_015700 [Coptis chinensis]
MDGAVPEPEPDPDPDPEKVSPTEERNSQVLKCVQLCQRNIITMHHSHSKYQLKLHLIHIRQTLMETTKMKQCHVQDAISAAWLKLKGRLLKMCIDKITELRLPDDPTDDFGSMRCSQLHMMRLD